MDKISRGVWPTHDTKTSMSPTASEPVAYRLVYLLTYLLCSANIYSVSRTARFVIQALTAALRLQHCTTKS